MTEDPPAYPRPASLADRLKVRGCWSCLYHHPPTDQCARQAPTQPTPDTGYCCAWSLAENHRMGWTSAFTYPELANAVSEGRITAAEADRLLPHQRGIRRPTFEKGPHEA